MRLLTPRMNLYELRYRCGSHTGTRRVWASSHRQAQRLLTDHPSVFGIPHERVHIYATIELHIQEAEVASVHHR